MAIKLNLWDNRFMGKFDALGDFYHFIRTNGEPLPPVVSDVRIYSKKGIIERGNVGIEKYRSKLNNAYRINWELPNSLFFPNVIVGMIASRYVPVFTLIAFNSDFPFIHLFSEQWRNDFEQPKNGHIFHASLATFIDSETIEQIQIRWHGDDSGDVLDSNEIAVYQAVRHLHLMQEIDPNRKAEGEKLTLEQIPNDVLTKIEILNHSFRNPHR
jgi:hypothetical protein